MIKYTLPTGYLIVDEYSKGSLETLSIGDYGKHHNVKADFLGYTNEINGVDNAYCMPLSEKWVVTLSTQHGCCMKCNFCDCPTIDFKGNVTLADLEKQLLTALQCFPNVKYTERLNIHFARMGEPIFNYNVFDFAKSLYKEKRFLPLRVETLHPVLTTCMPANFKLLEERLLEWSSIKNELYNGQAGLQLSINSTDDDQRTTMFGGATLSLKEISKLCNFLSRPVGRKYCLNFAYSSDSIIDAKVLLDLFDPERFMCKITPIHNNNACVRNGIQTIDGYTSYAPYRQTEEDLKSAGFDVLVFVPSIDEEDGLVTCGNAILGGGQLKVETKQIKIKGVQ